MLPRNDRFLFHPDSLAMQNHALHRTCNLGLAALLLIALVPVQAQDKRKTLTEARQEIIKGTSPGIVILEFGNARQASASASAPASGSISASASASAPAQARAAAAPATPAVTAGSGKVAAAVAAGEAAKPASSMGWWHKLPAPSGRPLSAARRLDAPDQGIPLPTAASPSRPDTSAPQPQQAPSKP